jgi:hypothetical protein
LANLPQIGQALGRVCLFSRLHQCRQEYRDENCDDRNDHEKLNEGERAARKSIHSFAFLAIGRTYIRVKVLQEFF